MSAKDYTKERWFALLAAAVASNPTGKAGVAILLGPGCSRPTVSRVLAGTYPNPKIIAQRVLEVFDRYLCPYLGVDIEAKVCREVNSGPEPVWDPAAMDQRDRCQTCPHKPHPTRQGDEK